MLSDALLLQLGYNATLVTLGAMMLGLSAGVAGTFLFLRKRALVSDAISHATLPGIALAFLVMVALGGDGRSLPGLLVGAVGSAGLGLAAVSFLSNRTRLGEDTAIGSVLSVFFGFGIVLLTVVQSVGQGQQAGLEGFLLGSTAGMLRGDATLIALSAGLTFAVILLMRRPLTLAAFDPGFAEVAGHNPRRSEAILMAVVLAVTVVGLKIVGLILIVALLIIPPVAARFWSEQSDRVLLIAGLIGGVSGYVGAAISAIAPDLPTGPIIVLSCFGLFALSFLLAPQRGVLAMALRHIRFRREVHLQQGLLAIAQGQPIYESLTRRLLIREGLIRADGVATPEGRAEASRRLRDVARWREIRNDPALEREAALYDGLTNIETVLTPDQLDALDARLSPQAEIG
ncbi:metal ABC transporter permease [Aliishimia ponticola]|uniref:Metal ABC transporter permease n=1 Tax=Aliishimia ponticola TaxID=2499833 RepID=A0A4S4NF59_9RHOB|nr:metal ABC transporter permease [Aliishimia ponticola]THH36761.1 metal ABC transporter permease [Aliishimia ponticola]